MIQHRLNDPRITPITSITRVELSADFSVARLHVSIMDRTARQELCLEALRSASGLLRRAIGRRLKMRKIPELSFRLDESVRGAFNTVQVIDDAMRELGERPEWDRDDELPSDAAPQQTEQARDETVADDLERDDHPG